MQRDNDLIRDLLMEIEGEEGAIYFLPLTSTTSDGDRKKYYHLKLLVDAGMLEENGRHGGSFRMTNAGHDFVEAVRSESRWNFVKEGVAKAGGATLELMADIALAYLRAELSKRLGVELG